MADLHGARDDTQLGLQHSVNPDPPVGLTRFHDDRLPVPHPGECRASYVNVEHCPFPTKLKLSAWEVRLRHERVNQKVAEILRVEIKNRAALGWAPFVGRPERSGGIAARRVEYSITWG